MIKAILGVVLTVGSVGVLVNLPTAWQNPILYVIPIISFAIIIDDLLS